MISEEVKEEIARLITDATDEGAKEGYRKDLFGRYMSEPYGDEVDGRSKFIDSTVSDAVEAVLPDLMDVFTSAPAMVEFNPIGLEDEAAAQQETDVVSHIFWQKNPGFENLYVWLKEALIQQNSYVWSGWVEKERVTIEEYEDLTPPEFLSIVNQLDGEYEFLEQSGFETIENEEGGEQYAISALSEVGEPEPISVKIRCVKTSKEYVIEPFPQEEFFGTPQWGKVGLKGIPCCGRVREMPKEELKAMGFSAETIEKASKNTIDHGQKDGRHNTADSTEQEADNKDVTVYETYSMVDLNDDGKLCLVKSWGYGDGSTFFDWEDGSNAVDEVSHIQISALTPFIIPHRHIGRALAELVDDIQAVKTVLTRQLLDNTYNTNHNRPTFDENQAGEHTFTDLSEPAPGAPVRTGGAEIAWHSPPPISGAVLPLLEKMHDLSEARTGATRYNQGLDSESLNKTMGGMKMILNASQKKMKLIARTMAETGIRDLFLRMHEDLRAGPMKSIAVKLRGTWVEVDPRTWAHRSDMTVAVGIGSGDNEMVRAGLTMLGNVQRELMSSGSRMVTEQNIYATVARVADTFGIRHIEPFINDPSKLPPVQPTAPPPDPVMEGIRVQDEKFKMDARRDAEKLKAEERQKEREHILKMRELDIKESEIANKIMTDEDRLELDKNKAVMDDDFKRDKLVIDAETGHMREMAKVVTSSPPVSYDSVTE